MIDSGLFELIASVFSYLTKESAGENGVITSWTAFCSTVTMISQPLLFLYIRKKIVSPVNKISINLGIINDKEGITEEDIRNAGWRPNKKH